MVWAQVRDVVAGALIGGVAVGLVGDPLPVLVGFLAGLLLVVLVAIVAGGAAGDLLREDSHDGDPFAQVPELSAERVSGAPQVLREAGEIVEGAGL